ncbi:uncharacterized protein LOC129942481 [Eupeodes corollae]|uniref:uncharacterized protein LOC129942481 n=1 Tax=Eupeodes corollae TaxID=290404 RepID=UPI002491541D|nr:uncharacterized protein LOC129942481 [Eupeodes corollae]
MDTSTGFIKLPTAAYSACLPDIAQKFNNHNWLGERAILAGKIKMSRISIGPLVSFKLDDTVMNQDDVVNYPTEFLNSLELPGIPSQNLQLKVGSVVIILRNMIQPRLCNGTSLYSKGIKATIIKGKYRRGCLDPTNTDDTNKFTIRY